MPPLQAYGWDIAGSMLGIAAFTILSAAGTPPSCGSWFAVVLVSLLLAGTDSGGLVLRLAGTAGLAVVLVLTFGPTSANEIWSPYYRINTYIVSNGELYVNVNGIPHQALHPVDAGHRGVLRPGLQVVPGSDVRQRPDRRVPAPARTSRSRFGTAPGTSTPSRSTRRSSRSASTTTRTSRTTTRGSPDHVNDGRAFLRGTDQKYDLVIFALPDSLTLVSTPRTCASSRSCSPSRPSSPSRDHLAPRRGVRALQLLPRPWLSRRSARCSRRAFDSAADAADVRRAQGDPRRRPLIDALQRRPPPGDAVDQLAGRRRARAQGRRPTTGRSSTCGRRSSRRTTSRRARIVLVIARPGPFGAARAAARPSAGSARTSSCWGSRSCCSRPGAWSASACCSARPGSSTRWRSSRSWRACCWRSS